MATRGTITFMNYDKVLVKLYNHADSYITGLGYSLANWLKTYKIGNGIPLGQSRDEAYANGVGCLVAQFIASFKTGPGDLYVISPDSSNKWIDYNYYVNIEFDDRETQNVNDVTEISITKFESPKVIFRGSPEELLSFVESDGEE